MIPTYAVPLAYAIVATLLWGYATVLFVQLKNQKLPNDSLS
jgi:hypothetical protein